MLIAFISCAPPVQSGGSGSGTEGPCDLSTMEGFQRALADDEYMQELEPVFTAAGAVESFMCGDLNGDGVVNNTDALLRACFYVGIAETGFIHPDAADIDDNGMIDIRDALLTAHYYVGLINGFSAERNLLLNGHFHDCDFSSLYSLVFLFPAGCMDG